MLLSSSNVLQVEQCNSLQCFHAKQDENTQKHQLVENQLFHLKTASLSFVHSSIHSFTHSFDSLLPYSSIASSFFDIITSLILYSFIHSHAHSFFC